MAAQNDPRRGSLALLTDLYQLTMAYGYWRSGMHETEAVFHLFYRRNPFGGGFTIACGLEPVVDFLRDLRLDETDVAYLRAVTGNDGARLFSDDFLDWLRTVEFTCDIDAMPEGTVAFPHEPLLRVRGPLPLAQIVETPLLNLVNFHTLIATKAARVCRAARGDPVIDFGLRRAQGIDGALAASRAAYIGGCTATSNVLAGKLHGIPVRGTHAHSWVMCFDDEEEAFERYARAMPNNCVFLVDTYDTIDGVRRAIEAGKRLRERGHRIVGIRLDSGELGELSRRAREMLDEAGFEGASIVASNDLDEHAIDKLKRDGATIDVWGVGTRLVTAYDQPALGGVYKLSAIRDRGESTWRHKLKLSEEPIKISNPGVLQVRRFSKNGVFAGDIIHDEEIGIDGREWVSLEDGETRGRLAGAPDGEGENDDEKGTPLLEPILRAGRLAGRLPGIEDARERARAQLEALPDALRGLESPAEYPVGLEPRLAELKRGMVRRLERRS